MIKKITALLLAAALMVGMIPVASAAPEPQTDFNDGGVQIEGTSSFGDLLSEEISQVQQESAEASAAYPAGYGITGLTFEGYTATVTYGTLEDAVLMVALYSEDGLQLLSTSKVPVLSGSAEAQVTFEDDMPDYFMASAYLLDIYDLSPLCPAYETPMYTRQMQELLASTVEDYDPERVLNLDEDQETNFAVYQEAVIQIEEGEAVNILRAYDPDTASYVIEAADETVMALQPGSIVVFSGAEELLIFKVEQIAVDDATATISGAELDLNEVFSHVKIEGAADSSAAVVDETTGDDGISFAGFREEGDANPNWEGSVSGSSMMEFEVECEFPVDSTSRSISIAGSLGINLRDITFHYYITMDEQFVNLSVDAQIDIGIKISDAFEKPLKLPEFTIPLGIPGIQAGFHPEFKFKCEVALEIDGTYTMPFVITMQGLLKLPQFNMGNTDWDWGSFDVSGAFSVSFDLKPTVSATVDLLIAKLHIIKLQIGMPIGLKITFLDESIDVPDTEKPSEIHGCTWCFGISIDVFFKFEFKAVFLESPKLTLTVPLGDDFTIPVADWFYCAEHNQFGAGACPNKKYLVTLEVLEETGDPCTDAAVRIGDTSYPADENGLLQLYLPEAAYVFYASNGERTSQRTEYIQKAQLVTIQLGMEYPDGASMNLFGTVSPEEITDYGYAVDSGVCGTEGDRKDNVKWTLYSNGTLKLTGHGRMRDYDVGDLLRVPWRGKRSLIKAVVVEGIENIGSLAFYDSPNIQSLKVSNSVTQIGWFAFGFNYGLKTVELGTGITNIASEAFGSCSGMTSITIPGKNLTFVGGNAFNDCSSLQAVHITDLDAWCRIEYQTLQSNPLYYADNLYLNGELVTEVTYPAGTTTVYGAAFANCNSLKKVTIPSGAKVIGSYAFFGCDNLTDISIPNSVTAIHYEAFKDCISLEHIDLPDYLTELPSNLFYNCSKLTDVTIPGGVTAIGSGAFYGCSSLTAMTIPQGVTAIEDQLFYKCSSLASVELPAALKTIGSDAFGSCARLGQITLPGTVTSIGKYAFNSCDSLVSVYAGTLADWCRISFGNDSANPLINGGALYLNGVLAADIVIPASITSVGNYAFNRCSSLRSVTIPDHVASIGDSAFTCCGSLQQVSIGNGVASIGSHAFSGCVSLQELSLGAGLTKIGSYAFTNCDSLTAIDIPDSVLTLGAYVFSNCDVLEEVVLGNGVTTFGNYAFTECPALKKLVIGSSLATTGEFAFYMTENIEQVHIPDLDTWLNLNCGYVGDPLHYGSDLYINGVRAEQITIPGYAGTLREEIFYGCESLKEVTIEAGITQIGYRAFYNCVNLCSISIPDTVQRIGHSAFMNCSSLGSITIPASVTEMGNNLFYGCTGLTKAVLAAAITELESSAFCDCTSLASVVLPDTLQTLGGSSFYGCTSLTEVILPASLTSIGGSSFYGCTALKQIALPAGITSIGGSAFYNCTSLEALVLPASLTSISNKLLQNCTALTSVTIPNGATSIGSYAFSDCSALRSVQLPDSVTTIEEYAFYNCKGLTGLHLSNSLTQISNCTFLGCKSLRSVRIPEGITVIGDSAFNGCSGLKHVTLPDSLETICSNAFSGCTGLSSILIPAGVTEIRNFAFYNCTGIGEIVFTGEAPTFGNNYVFYNVTAAASYPADLSSWTEAVLLNYGGTITWSPLREAAELVLVEYPFITSYAAGEALDLSGIRVEQVAPDGTRTALDTGLLRVGACDLTTAGARTVTLTYGDGSVSYDVYVHHSATEELVDPSLYPESNHNAVQSGEMQVLTYPGARALTLTFSDETDMEYYNAYIYVYNGRDQLVQSYYDNRAAGVTLSVPGDTVKISVTCNWNDVYGYSFDRITADMVVHTGETIPGVPATCTQDGTSDGILCAFCGIQAYIEPIPALGHDYQSVITAPTPESDGYTTHTCTRCGHSYKDNYTTYSSIASGTCGASASWALLENGTLRIFGEGPMEHFTGNTIPWYSYKDQILAVEIKDGITSIGNYAFRNCSNLVQADIADTVSAIGNYSFYYCTSLSSIAIPEAVTSIGSYAFRNCTSLTELTLPDAVTELGSNAFSHCAGLTRVHLGSGLTSIGNYGFRSCTALEELHFTGNAPTFGSYVFNGVTADCYYPADNATWTAELLQGYGGTITWIASGGAAAAPAIDNRERSEAAILPATPEPIRTQIPDVQIEAVYGGEYTTVDTEAYTLKTASFEGLVPGAEYVLLAIASTEPADLIAADNLLYIAQAAALEDGTLSFQYVQRTAVEISYVMACGASGRDLAEAEITFPEMHANGAVQAVHPCVVYNGTVLTEGLDYVIVGEASYTDGGTYTCFIRGIRDYTGLVECSYTVEHMVQTGWSGDTSWRLSSSGVLTFSGEGAMKNYTYKSEMPWYAYADRITDVVIEEGVTSIGSYAFYGMNVESIEIADSVTSIGDYAFKNAPKIDNVVLPEGLTSLGDSAFYACTSLTAIEIPASLWTIKPYTFKNCTALAEVTFNEGNLQKISDGAFYGTALTELVLPDCLDILDVYSFKNCTELASITIGNSLTEIREAVFYGTAIPEITIPEGITKIGPYAFKNCVALETIDLPESLTSVGEAAFYADTALTTVELPDAVTSIGNYAFRKCAAIEELTFGAELVTVGECAFYGCTGLTELVIPDKVTTIKPYAFKTCEGLTSVVLGASVKTIGEGAFNTCTGLKTIVFPASVGTIGSYCFSGSYNLWKLTFEGDAPAIGAGAFKGMAATVWYPGSNATWTSDRMLSYGGSITWKAY